MTGFGEDSSYEEREVPLLLLKNADKCFLVRVAGDSMQDAGIQDGAFIVAEKMNPLFERPPNGSIVVAAVEDQMIIKRYRHRHNKYDLISENRNRNYSPISISSDMSDHHSIYIFGVFQRVIPESMIDMALS
jgi:DNA polymerase V